MRCRLSSVDGGSDRLTAGRPGLTGQGVRPLHWVKLDAWVIRSESAASGTNVRDDVDIQDIKSEVGAEIGRVDE